MAATMNVGQALPIAIQYLDQNGNVMSPPPTPDAAPTWSNSDNTIGTLVVGANGQTAVETGVAAGTTNVGVSLAVGGKSFSATLAVTVAVPAPVLTSIALVPGTPA